MLDQNWCLEIKNNIYKKWMKIRQLIKIVF